MMSHQIKFLGSLPIFLILVFLIPNASAQETLDKPLVYDVQITLMDISDVDYANGGYSLSFWIRLSSDEIDFSTTPPPIIDFVNGKIDVIDHE